MPTLRGSCHCGRIEAAFSTQQEPESLHPRACDCSFCRKHGASWLSDSAGHLAVSTREGATSREYRQGSGNARFLLCGDCGVLVAVAFDTGEGVLGAVNGACLDSVVLGTATTVSPQQLPAIDKMSRWRALWTPMTVLQ